ncbi:hypothetical protein QCA50_013818 [Cerrena zonata]|uniref:Ribosome recycling factor domain-containing protein n=1 Tax=Cerrena zonata TaxID=2478898 RepID=A0AAW0FPD2_9APHY
MSSILRHSLNRLVLNSPRTALPGINHLPILQRVSVNQNQVRCYAKKNNKRDRDEEDVKPGKGKGKVSTGSLVPGSQAIQADPVYIQCEDKMKGISEKFRRDVAAYETRASGRITPAVLAPVRVMLPENKDSDGKGVRLEEVATVGVRDGTTLLVTAFEERTLKFIEQGIYDAKIAGVIPQAADSRTIKIPMAKPTVEARQAFYLTASKQAEEFRVQVRKHHQAFVKKGAYEKRSSEITEFQKLTDKYIKAIDQTLADFKKVTGAK